MTALDERAIKALEPIHKALERLDPETQFHVANKLNDVLLEAQGRLAEVRRHAVRTLRTEGYSLVELGKMLGVSHARVHQIEQGYGRKEKQARRGGR